jgi:hypothetical protein
LPHITVLCSLLFLLYINDLPFNIHGANFFVFADDINVLITDIDVDGVIKELESWFQRSDLIINVGKTEVMSCHSRQKKKRIQEDFKLPSMNLIYTAETKFLGVYIMEKLKCNTHVKSLANKLSKVCFYLSL